DITGAGILGEFGAAPGRYATAKARKNYAGTSPLTIQSGKKKTVHARYIRNRHLIDALHAQALSALSASPGARAFYDDLRAREIGHDDALRRVASRLTGILHGCLKTGREDDEATAWSPRAETPEAACPLDNLPPPRIAGPSGTWPAGSVSMPWHDVIANRPERARFDKLSPGVSCGHRRWQARLASPDRWGGVAEAVRRARPAVTLPAWGGLPAPLPAAGPASPPRRPASAGRAAR